MFRQQPGKCPFSCSCNLLLSEIVSCFSVGLVVICCPGGQQVSACEHTVEGPKLLVPTLWYNKYVYLPYCRNYAEDSAEDEGEEGEDVSEEAEDAEEEEEEEEDYEVAGLKCKALTVQERNRKY